MFKIDNNSAFSLPTEKELKLVEKHSLWLNNSSGLEDEYLPNDNAVPYTLMLVEIVECVYKTSVSGIDNLVPAVDKFFQIAGAALQSQSNTSAYKTLATTPDSPEGSYNPGLAIRNYVSDGSRNARNVLANGDLKLLQCTQRSVRRLYRLCAVTTTGRGPFSLLNLPTKVMVGELIALKTKEVAIAAAIKKADKIGVGVEGLSDAESMTWLMVNGRGELWEYATGRNDLSVPALVGGIVGLQTSAFGGLKPRSWAHVSPFVVRRKSDPGAPKGHSGPPSPANG